MEKLRHLLGFPLNDEYREEVERNIEAKNYRMYLVLGITIMVSQAMMMIAISIKGGGPFTSQRRTVYFYLYMALFLISLVMLILKMAGHRLVPHYRYSRRLNYIYLVILCLWSTGITLNDQLGGNGLDVFSYISLTAAVFGVLAPWMAILLFGSNFVLLNMLLPYFPDPSGADQTFNNLINSFFITLFAVIVGTIFYRSRILAEHDRLLIENQYKKIEEMNRKLTKEVLTDKLTGSYNRRYMDENLEMAFRKSRESGGVACLMLDIDFFKQYNDTYGHQRGDQCLVAIASMLRQETEKANAAVIRYGGEEFLVFLYGKDAFRAMELATRLKESVEKGRYPDDIVMEGHVTISIGVYRECPVTGSSTEQFIFRADQALYKAKRDGRNCIVEYQGNN